MLLINPPVLAQVGKFVAKFLNWGGGRGGGMNGNRHSSLTAAEKGRSSGKWERYGHWENVLILLSKSSNIETFVNILAS